MAVPPQPQSSSSPQRAALSRDLADFLVELSIALHKHAMYPSDHPSLEPAAVAVVHRAESLLMDRTTVSLGVARRQLVIEGVATDPKHPVLRELADRLHRHHLGAVTFSRGLTVEELREALRVLAVEADRSGQPLGLGSPEALRRWPHVRLHALTYERLELVDEGAAPDAQAGGARARAAQLWLGLARAALASEASDESPASTEPAAIAKAIDERSTEKTAAYDQAIVGYLLQIAEELKTSGSAEGAALRRRMSRLVRTMKPETLRRLVEMGGDLAQRRRFVADAADGMALDAVLEIVRAAADTSHQTISHALVRMLSKFAAHAEAGTGEARPQADAALRQQVRELLEGWTLADPTPGAYGAALQRMARTAPLFAAPADSAYPTEPERIVAMGLELDIAGQSVLDAVDRVIAAGGTLGLFEALDQGPAVGTAARVRERLTTVDFVRRLVAADPVDFKTLDRVVPLVGPPAAEPLLDALASAESRGVRRGLLGLLARLGAEIGPAAVSRLEDSRWYVVRNLLSVLDEIGTVPAGFSPARYADHADPRVRWQALKLQLKRPGDERDAALAAALGDADGRVRRLGLAVAQQGCPDTLVPLVARCAADRSLPSDERTQAIRALGAARASAARNMLLQITAGGRTWLGRQRLAAKSPEMLAALAALVAGWSQDAAVRSVLARAAASKDPDIRHAATVEPPPR